MLPRATHKRAPDQAGLWSCGMGSGWRYGWSGAFGRPLSGVRGSVLPARWSRVGLEGDSEAGAGGGREALQGFGGWLGATALQAGDYGLGRRHAAGELGLRESGFRAGLDDGAGELEFGRQGFVGLAIGRLLQPFAVKVVQLGH